jgi:L-rhamnose mutarotase
MAEYKVRHENVWADMLQMLRETGWTNYSLFLDENDGTLIGYVECENFEASLAGMGATDVNARWQADMAPFFIALDGKNPDEGFLLLEEVFHLD